MILFSIGDIQYFDSICFRYLCLRNKDTAQMAFVKYTESHPDVRSGPPYIHPLLNFLWFLLLAVEG